MKQANIRQYDLSLNQKALWFIHELDGDAKSAYNEPLVYSLEGFVSLSALKKAFNATINKHATLRTSFQKSEEGDVYQIFHEASGFELMTSESKSEQEASTHITNFIKRPFDLTKPGLIRAELIKINSTQHILAIVMHHIITDGISFEIFINDLNTFYNSILNDDANLMVEANTSYFDHVESDKRKFLSEDYEMRVDEFAHTLKDYSGLHFMTTPMMHEKVDLYSGDRVYFTIDTKLFNDMAAFVQQNGTTLFHFLFSVYAIFLSQYTRNQDILIGVPFANRSNDPEKNTLGYFANILPVRIGLDKQSDFLNLLKNTQSLIFSHFTKQDIAFERVAAKLNLDRKATQHPLLQTMFVLGNTHKLKLNFDGVTSTLQQHYFSETAKFDFSLFMMADNKEKITAFFEYRSVLFDKSMVERLANGFLILIKNILKTPKDMLSLLNMIDDAEQNRMKKELFTAKLDRVVTQNLGQLFSITAKQFPSHTGLISGDKHYSYEEIDTYSNRWAAFIRSQYQAIYNQEMPNDTLIGLCVDRNEDMIFGMLGILKAGAAYVPIDPHYPQERINYIIEHSKVALMLTHSIHAELTATLPSERIIYMDELPTFETFELTHTIYPQDIAYVLYTSGSTGKPKGVAVTHENVICLFESLKKQFQFSPNDVWSLFHTYCFDISVWEIWGAFLFGGALVMVPFATTRDPKQFYQLIAEEGVSVLSQTASAFQMFINEDMKSAEKLNKLRYVAFVGESLKVSILRPWVEKYGTDQPRLANMYGITETTVYTNYKFIDQSDIDKGRDNIGWPLEEFSMCIMDENLQWCPVGIVGEICIGGRGLSRGYLYRDDLTQEKFMTDPYADFLGLKNDIRLYQTGDLGRWLEDGSIEYLGRKDFQIKLRGFRIELGEIEAALGSFSGISHTTVLLKGEGDAAFLAAYYTVKPAFEVSSSELRAHLKSFLPDYMMPKKLIELKSFPMTMNGKVDRRELQGYDDTVKSLKTTSSLRTPLDEDIALSGHQF